MAWRPHFCGARSRKNTDAGRGETALRQIKRGRRTELSVRRDKEHPSMSGLDTTASFPAGGYESKESLSRADTHEDVTPNEIAVGVIIGRSSEYFVDYETGTLSGPAFKRVRLYASVRPEIRQNF
jgi:hypothetical protein